jgi:hypothetical protein
MAQRKIDEGGTTQDREKQLLSWATEKCIDGAVIELEEVCTHLRINTGRMSVKRDGLRYMRMD